MKNGTEGVLERLSGKPGYLGEILEKLQLAQAMTVQRCLFAVVQHWNNLQCSDVFIRIMSRAIVFLLKSTKDFSLLEKAIGRCDH